MLHITLFSSYIHIFWNIYYVQGTLLDIQSMGMGVVVQTNKQANKIAVASVLSEMHF